MTMLKTVEVRYERPDGTSGVLNYLTSDNAAVNTPEDYDRLLARANAMVVKWQEIFIYDRIFVNIKRHRRRS